jgi:hypothetical protein
MRGNGPRNVWRLCNLKLNSGLSVGQVVVGLALHHLGPHQLEIEKLKAGMATTDSEKYAAVVAGCEIGLTLS